MRFNTFQAYYIRVFFNQILLLTHCYLETTIRSYLVAMDGLNQKLVRVSAGRTTLLGSLSLSMVFNVTLPNWISIKLAQLQEQRDVPIIQPHTVIIQS